MGKGQGRRKAVTRPSQDRHKAVKRKCKRHRVLPENTSKRSRDTARTPPALQNPPCFPTGRDRRSPIRRRVGLDAGGQGRYQPPAFPSPLEQKACTEVSRPVRRVVGREAAANACRCRSVRHVGPSLGFGGGPNGARVAARHGGNGAGAFHAGGGKEAMVGRSKEIDWVG